MQACVPRRRILLFGVELNRERILGGRLLVSEYYNNLLCSMLVGEQHTFCFGLIITIVLSPQE